MSRKESKANQLGMEPYWKLYIFTSLIISCLSLCRFLDIALRFLSSQMVQNVTAGMIGHTFPPFFFSSVYRPVLKVFFNCCLIKPLNSETFCKISPNFLCKATLQRLHIVFPNSRPILVDCPSCYCIVPDKSHKSLHLRRDIFHPDPSMCKCSCVGLLRN